MGNINFYNGFCKRTLEPSEACKLLKSRGLSFADNTYSGVDRLTDEDLLDISQNYLQLVTDENGLELGVYWFTDFSHRSMIFHYDIFVRNRNWIKLGKAILDYELRHYSELVDVICAFVSEAQQENIRLASLIMKTAGFIPNYYGDNGAFIFCKAKEKIKEV